MALYEGVAHSLEECGIPFQGGRVKEEDSNKECSVFDIVEAPLGMIVVIGSCELMVYYSRYDRNKTVLQYVFSVEMEVKRLYRLARRIGCNVANLIYGKAMKELEWNSN